MADQRAAAHRDSIVITGARENNLRDVCLRIPKEKIVVFTGVSGSGKSSLVFDTVAVESQRQLNETFTWFIRNRMPKHEKPDADAIENLSAAIVVDQKPIGGNSRSTVGTMTDIYALIRLLFSRHGTPSAGGATAYSFNDPAGMCTACDGLGRTNRIDLDALLDTRLSLNGGAIRFHPFAVGGWQWRTYAGCDRFDADKPLADYTDEEWHTLLHGKGFIVEITTERHHSKIDFEGIVPRFTRLYLNRDLSTLGDKTRTAVERVVAPAPCRDCGGARLNPAALATRINGRSIADYSAMEVTDLLAELDRIDAPVAAPIVAAASTALRRVERIGLGYLSLDRETATLSGGESQRLKMVRHLGSALTGMTYVFDEPSVGLHPRDVHRLNDLLAELRDKGNTVLVVEHDRDVIAVADHVIDIGPGAGADGGRIVYEGTFAGLAAAATPTGAALRAVSGVKSPVRTPTGWYTLAGADRHNLKDITVRFPTGVLTAVTGVAGSGKSTLVSDVFVGEHPDAVVVDQSAIGASARSCPATYLGIMDEIRRIFAKENGVDAGLFSFNSRGACAQCQGRGVIYVDLAYMDPVTMTCGECGGRRFKEAVLRHTVGGWSVADVLDATAGQVRDLFPQPRIRRGLDALGDVGLGYLSLGQPLSSLSGGERQRIKLATELHATGGVYVLDEPTTGLHMADIGTLVALLDRLVDAGNTVVVIEHDLDVVKRADWVIDLGPDGGRNGGEVVFEGTPAQLLGDAGSLTAEYLRRDIRRAEPVPA
ncbi:ATP-binding cassette domain-containing protein [Nocardiopsis sediminis]|uniref:UvrABC system protein A n=1 Tax=Nocardiopsis sediminis TaxID=1778267 RepID=A0ABV8FRA2_9ACTN